MSPKKQMNADNSMCEEQHVPPAFIHFFKSLNFFPASKTILCTVGGLQSFKSTELGERKAASAMLTAQKYHKASNQKT